MPRPWGSSLLAGSEEPCLITNSWIAHATPLKPGTEFLFLRFRKQQGKRDAHTGKQVRRVTRLGTAWRQLTHGKMKNNHLSFPPLNSENQSVSIFTRTKDDHGYHLVEGSLKRHQRDVWNLILIKALKRRQRNTPELTPHKTRLLKMKGEWDFLGIVTIQTLLLYACINLPEK